MLAHLHTQSICSVDVRNLILLKSEQIFTYIIHFVYEVLQGAQMCSASVHSISDSIKEDIRKNKHNMDLKMILHISYPSCFGSEAGTRSPITHTLVFLSDTQPRL